MKHYSRQVSRAAAILILIATAVYGISLAKAAIAERSNRPKVPHLSGKASAGRIHTARANRIAKEYGSLPLRFEANEGQTDPSVQFVSHGPGYALFLGRDEAVLELQKQDTTDALLQKLPPKIRKRFEAEKLFQVSPRFHRHGQAETVRLGITGANPNARMRPLDELPTKSNYFVGRAPKDWRTGIPNYGEIEYDDIYPGVNLAYHGNQGQMEFDFVVAPHADPSLISLHIQANQHPRLAKDGSLRMDTSGGPVVLGTPAIYQNQGKGRTLIQGGFALKGDGEVGFRVGKYDKTKPLVIDPVLGYLTYLGGTGTDIGLGIAVDSIGDAYIVGQATSVNFPTQNGYPSSPNANGIAFVSELNPTGTALLYSTYLGGSGGESGSGIALDPSGSVYVTGSTQSSDFPIVNGLQTSLGTPNGSGFVARINTTQVGVASLVYSTYLGGGGNDTNSLGDYGFGIAADASGLAYITGQTTSDASKTPFPTTASAFQSTLANPNGNAFLTVLDTTQAGSASLVYSTYLGGDSTGFGDWGEGVAVDSTGDAFLTGGATSGGATPFPTTLNAYQPTLKSPYGNAFVTEIATQQSGSQSLVYSTYLGGSSNEGIGDSGAGIALDSSGKIYVVGDAESSDFPVTSGAFQTTNANGNAFVAKLDPTQSGAQSLIYSTFLGGTNGEEGDFATAIAVDANGNAFISGASSDSDFPTTQGALLTNPTNGLWNAYFTQLNATGSSLLYSTYIGGNCNNGFGDLGYGVAVDGYENAYVDGRTCSSRLLKNRVSAASSLCVSAIYEFRVTVGAAFLCYGASQLPFPDR